jgi:hypothetical protein
MFDLLGRGEGKEEIARLRKQIAAAQGQITAIHVLLQTVIDRMPERERKNLIETWKHAVAQGLRGKAPWLDKDHWQEYNDAMSAMIHAFLEAAHRE